MQLRQLIGLAFLWLMGLPTLAQQCARKMLIGKKSSIARPWMNS